MSTTETPTKGGRLTLHHLNDSQSQRILWLLEELGVDYDLVLHTRDPKLHRAPPSLTAVPHALGKSPIIVDPAAGTIIESSAIATFLLRTYDTSGRFGASNWVRDETLVSFAGATLGPLNAVELLFDLAAKNTPWPLVYISRRVRKGIQNFYTGPEFKKTMGYLVEQLGDEMWFNSKEPGRSDFLLSWPLDMMAHRKWVNIEKEYPTLAAWRMRIQERPAWKRGLEKGNGYDLSSW